MSLGKEKQNCPLNIEVDIKNRYQNKIPDQPKS